MRRADPVFMLVLLVSAMLACKRKPPVDEETPSAAAEPVAPAPPPPAPPPATPTAEPTQQPIAPVVAPPPARPAGTSKPTTAPTTAPTTGATAAPTGTATGTAAAPTGTATAAPTTTATTTAAPQITRKDCLDRCEGFRKQGLAACVGPLAGEACTKQVEAGAENCRGVCPKQ